MNWYYTVGPTHTRVRVFMNGANCGELCFRNDEFTTLMNAQNAMHNWCAELGEGYISEGDRNITFINETPQLCPS